MTSSPTRDSAGRCVRTTWERLEGDAYLFDEFHVVASGGASGQRGRVRVRLGGVGDLLHVGRSVPVPRLVERSSSFAEVPRVAAVVAAANATHISGALGRTFSGAGTTRHFLPVTLPLDDIVAGLNDLQPTILQGYSSVLHRLALEARRGVLAHSTPPDQPDLRAPPARDESAPGRGVGCPDPQRLRNVRRPLRRRVHSRHPPAGRLVPRRAGRQHSDGAAAPAQTSDRIRVTNLYNSAVPLIRFEVTDEVAVVPGSCPCGSVLRRVGDPQGRLDDTFFVPRRHQRASPRLPRCPRTAPDDGRVSGVPDLPRGHIAIVAQGPIDETALAARVATALEGRRSPTTCHQH